MEEVVVMVIALRGGRARNGCGGRSRLVLATRTTNTTAATTATRCIRIGTDGGIGHWLLERSCTNTTTDGHNVWSLGWLGRHYQIRSRLRTRWWWAEHSNQSILLISPTRSRHHWWQRQGQLAGEGSLGRPIGTQTGTDWNCLDLFFWFTRCTAPKLGNKCGFRRFNGNTVIRYWTLERHRQTPHYSIRLPDDTNNTQSD